MLMRDADRVPADVKGRAILIAMRAGSREAVERPEMVEFVLVNDLRLRT
jgi:hypothetical protein